jgi:taurine dioxygenase
VTTTTTTTTTARDDVPLSGPRVASRTPADWEDRPYTRFTLRPLSPTIGAEVEGVALAALLDDELRAELNRALLEWKVLFFRDQHLTHTEQAEFARHWGPLESHPFAQAASFGRPEERPEVVRLEKGADAKGYENVWHSDVTWRTCPSLGSVLRAVEVPSVGGDTLWADMAAAYDCLPDGVTSRIDSLSAVHDWLFTFGRGMDAAAVDALRPNFPAVEHPVVRTHPETGRKTLFVNRAFTQHIVGLDRADSDELLDFLYRQASFPEYQCRFRWTPGAVAFWDNRSTQHYASSDYYPQRRVMERITIIGDRPY